ncbi:MAG TPA: tRNA 2-thiocytidine(32) synthetase TtcA, partial [Gammaproteobacteria bacterium]|nr:tRNA 2-thiocytidine(32) synthetase TtcA [Gammaproteobacteria bacterium]
MLRSWEKQFPGRLENIFRSMQNVVPSHLADGELFDFKGLHSTDAEEARVSGSM